MPKNLMIIESPNKIRTIAKYLSTSDFSLLATYGHLRDLSKWGMGFDQLTLEPNWVNVSGNVKKKTKNKSAQNKNVKDGTGKSNKPVSLIKEINKEADKAEVIYLSTDPDREGEAISWHVYCILSEANKAKCQRVVFNEITEKAIKLALLSPRPIDLNQVNSYLARRLLDREVGFKLSSYVRSRIGGNSAGRVQSIALKFLKDRELEIQNFAPEFWFTIETKLKNKLELKLKKISPEITNYQLNKNVKDGKINFLTQKDAEIVKNSLHPDFQFIKEHASQKEKIQPRLAFKTSTMQQEGINRLKLSSKAVESLAQKLYEGVEINGNVLSLITYPRTDRTDLSTTFIDDAQAYILKNYGSSYYQGPRQKKKNAKSNKELVQGAHEAIRPTDLTLTPESVKPYLKKGEYDLYTLIWTAALGSLMSDSIYEFKYYDFINNQNLFTAFSRKNVFDGFEKMYKKYKYEKESTDADKPQDIHVLDLNKLYPSQKVAIEQHDKKPPSRYNEASLIRVLEKEGIGRPSTYTSIANTVLNRQYAIKKSSALVPTELGLNTTVNLEINFPKIMSFDYTSKIESGLDNIAEEKIDWKNFLHQIFAEFNDRLVNAKENTAKKEHEKTGQICPKCQGDLIYRQSFRMRNSKKFIGCSNFPKCNYLEPLVKPVILEEKCPECQSNLTERLNRRGEKFIGCTGWPKCNYIKDRKEKFTKTKKIQKESSSENE